MLPGRVMVKSCWWYDRVAWQLSGRVFASSAKRPGFEPQYFTCLSCNLISLPFLVEQAIQQNLDMVNSAGQKTHLQYCWLYPLSSHITVHNQLLVHGKKVPFRLTFIFKGFTLFLYLYSNKISDQSSLKNMLQLVLSMDACKWRKLQNNL